MPASEEAERALLGAIMMNVHTFDRVSEFLQPYHFHNDMNAFVFDAMIKLKRKNVSLNPITLRPMVVDSGIWVGDAANQDASRYLAALAGSAVTVINAVDYAKLIIDYWTRREIIMEANELAKAARYIGEATALEVIEDHEAKMQRLLNARGGMEGGLLPMSVIMTRTQERWELEQQGIIGVSSGYPSIDAKLHGLQDGDLLILAGRPSMGKTALATNMAFRAAHFFRTTDNAQFKGKQVAFFSLEMPAEALGGRILTGETYVTPPRFRPDHTLEEHEWAKIVEAAADLGDLPFWVDDGPGQTCSSIRSRCLKLHRKKPLGLVVIDYLQLINLEKSVRADNRVGELSYITRTLKELARLLKCPVICLSQLSRQVEQREDKRPMLSDLRESGTIEQDADIVMFTFREEYYLERQVPRQRANENQEDFLDRFNAHADALDAVRNKAEVIVAKQRNGPIGIITLFFDGVRTSFEEWDEQDRAPRPDDGGQGSMDL